MEQAPVKKSGLVLVLLTWMGLVAADPAGAGAWTLSGGPLGAAVVYAPSGTPGSVVLFVSGDGGWDGGVVDMARQLQGWGALVVGIDIRHCAGRAGQPDCTPSSAVFGQLAQRVEKRAGIVGYQPPLVVGYSSGADLVLRLLQDAPAGTFAGGISLGFCAGRQPAHGGTHVAHPRAPWIVLHGARDQVCPADATREFVADVSNAKFVLLPDAGHGFSVEASWLPQFRDAYLKLVTASARPTPIADAVADLPLVEVPAPPGGGPFSDTFVVLLTGDGGWAGLDRDVAAALVERGVPVVAWSSLRYFWTARTPAAAGRDLDRVIRYYSAAWKRPRVLLVGYSFGANVLPFLAGHLSSDALRAVGGLGLVGPATHAEFEVRVADWIPGSVPAGRPVAPALQALASVPVLCIYSQGEPDSLCPDLPSGVARVVNLPGGHHFGGDSATLAREILGLIGR